jgi:hypothetical protein
VSRRLETAAQAVMRFERDVARHQLTIERNEGVSRQLLFRKPGDSAYWFRLVTWPGALCISGDMGTYVFWRLHDMFEFFRGERINPDYWAEKVQGPDARQMTTEFVPEQFRAAAVRRFREWWADELNSKDDYVARRRCWDELRREVLEYDQDGEVRALDAAYSFEFKHQPAFGRMRAFRLEDFYECNMRAHTFHFLWCCHAIRWGIEQFDRATAPATQPETETA